MRELAECDDYIHIGPSTSLSDSLLSVSLNIQFIRIMLGRNARLIAEKVGRRKGREGSNLGIRLASSSFSSHYSSSCSPHSPFLGAGNLQFFAFR